MDLVDIDKVLDDLELNEDDGTSTATKASDTRSSVRESGVSVNGTTTEQAAAVGPAPVSQEKLKFKANVVNVSTVFSSLNEYVNAGGTELGGVKHASLHDSHDLGIPSERKPLLTPPSNSSISSDVKTSNSAAATSSSVPTSPQHVVSSPTTSPDSSASSVSCCSSRAASSSASSSAHSSSRSSSSSASSSASSSDAEDGDKRAAKGERALGHVHEKLPEELSSLSADDYVLDTSSMTTLATTNEGAARKGATTADAQDTSAFSYKNSLYSDTLSNDVINLEGISSISSIVAVDLTKSAREAIGLVEGAPVAKDEIETTAQDDVERPVKPPDADDARKPVVGFESTMDDVSDTELESYLQELEEFDFRSVNVESTVPPKPEAESFTVPDTAVETQPEVEHAAVELESTVPIVKDRADENSIDSRSDDEISPSSSRGDNEEDLISQASTLEFNDLAMGATAAVAATTPHPPAIGAPVVEAPEGAMAMASELDIPIPVDTEVSGDFPLDEDGSEIKFIDCTETESERRLMDSPEDEINRMSLSHPERPTSLELGNGIVTEGDGLVEGNFPSSPGHTPPSSRALVPDQGLTLSSTSSDDFAASIEGRTAAHGGVVDDGSRLAIADPIQSPIAAPITVAPLLSPAQAQLGKIQPFWVPDNSTKFCMQCNQKFSVIKRRHHCRACGQVLCSSCCCLKAKLEYLGDVEARVCIECDVILSIQQQQAMEADHQHQQLAGAMATDGRSLLSAGVSSSNSRQPNPNNPMEYCSVIPPLQQAAASNQPQSPISVMVPVGVLKRAGAPRNMRKDKNVIFSDGIRPGCDLTELDQNWDAVPTRTSPPRSRKPRVQTPPGGDDGDASAVPRAGGQLTCLIPPEENKLPPVLKRISPTESKLVEIENDASLLEGLREVTLTFAIQKNFHVLVTVVELACCINRTVINFTTRGLHYVGQDEIIILLVLGDSRVLPKDIFTHLNEIYCEADRGHIITELGFSPARSNSFLGSKNHGGFLYVRPTYQCMKAVITPEAPYLIGILIHRWEVPWAKILPLRLMLRLGALYQYYPCPHVSERERESVYVEIAQTIVNLLADFRHFSYTIPSVRGMVIHLEDHKTSILIPRNRYEQMVKVVDGSSEQLMAVGGNFSKQADGHLVCIQNTESGCPEATQYTTQAIDIESQPRKVTGASFLVLDGSLKPNSGLTGRCTILEDGLKVLIPPVKLQLVKEALKAMKDYQIVCGPTEGDDSQKELVSIEWTANDLNFNIGVTSPIDRKAFDGVPSIRVHRGTDYSNSNHIIRWTEVFILKGDEESNHPGDPINMSKVSETVAKTACKALIEYLDLLASNGHTKLALRISSNRGQMAYVAGSGGNKLAPLYSNALGQVVMELLERQATALHLDQHDIVFELIFHILDK
ncbi:zinc finger FYVE domain-containing protein 9 [Anopheles stephensi]|uniref:zinc finger FYVE domain-containing protein 9 n=1 Tax=Anopheles stephensi TaxID=30069 RepID=UPI001658BBCE|nr:zinc finger FYVE domain-containing protein 9 [Anopheles stephensi]XP_035900515.1 zinc finger FYVE domain-containing protein 9 [Anopheles stephensi]XP_035900516.1 zinc finger FYVE domain-containing protein 9 [Anopheles stephensi]XP_035900517.1 zinc finger FYVE domain-containing protein 9 [Anopheles stephensi]XP_035900518.1 zinc finger FYVE domain-containing protein 9 [Anopheles stephensi]XP_035900519.1 zinc finger FYVE domain-containing protein 9 [Anopheles stephensi]XP_035900520.1 zinc fin